MSQTFSCFGLVIHGYSADEAVRRIDAGIAERGQVMVVTANPEILLAGRRNPKYWNVLRQADLRLADGFGLQLIGWLKGARPSRIPGVDFAERLIDEAVARNWKVGLIGGAEGVAERAARELRRKHPNLAVHAEGGGSVSRDGTEDDSGAEALFRLTEYAPDVLFVAFGHPRQESWIVKNLANLPSVKVAMGVGGTFDYWSGNVKRAPKFVQEAGLEWLYRVVAQPSRWRRIVDAVIVFPIVAIADILVKPDHQIR